jgi:prepilin-type N-terminal cleavage/methylation domain-containing protein
VTITRHRRIRSRSGFTIIELLIAVIVFSVALLALAGTSTRVADLSGRGRRSGMASTLAFQRLEVLRARGCLSQASGSDSLMSASGVVQARNQWSFTDLGTSMYRIRLIVTYPARATTTRVDTLDQELSCRR